MPTFSIIIPVYNVEKYIEKCIESVLNQTYNDYEIIVVNDGTQDNSIELAQKYPVKIINQKNQGLSAARNTGVENSNGKYLVFLDSDDYLEKDLLKNLKKSTKNKPDIIRYQAFETYSDKRIEYNEEPFENENGEKAFEKITKFHYVDPSWLYVVNREYYIKNSFKFTKGIYHEDFALTPILVCKAKRVNCINYLGYNYVQRDQSIMRENTKEKQIKKVENVIDSFKDLKENGQKNNISTKYYYSYIANSVINKICTLDKDLYKKYKKIIKKEKLTKLIIKESISQKIKCIIINISPKIYFKIKNK